MKVANLDMLILKALSTSSLHSQSKDRYRDRFSHQKLRYVHSGMTSSPNDLACLNPIIHRPRLSLHLHLVLICFERTLLTANRTLP